MRRRVYERRGSWRSTKVAGKNFGSQAEAAVAEAAEMSGRFAHQRRSARHAVADAAALSGAVPPTLAPRRSGKPKPSPHHNYPTQGRFKVAMQARAAMKAHFRLSFKSDQTALMIKHARGKAAHTLTMQDRQMIANPKAKLSKNRISRNHKLADSNVAAITYHIADQLGGRSAGTDSPDPLAALALKRFCRALGADDKVVVPLFWSAARNKKGRSSIVRLIIPHLSNGLRNLRFGDAQLNGLILHAFDPNVDRSGTRTPESEEIYSAVHNLAKAGLITEGLAASVTTPLSEKGSEDPGSGKKAMITSSVAVGPLDPGIPFLDDPLAALAAGGGGPGPDEDDEDHFDYAAAPDAEPGFVAPDRDGASALAMVAKGRGTFGDARVHHEARIDAAARRGKTRREEATWNRRHGSSSAEGTDPIRDDDTASG